MEIINIINWYYNNIIIPVSEIFHDNKYYLFIIIIILLIMMMINKFIFKFNISKILVYLYSTVFSAYLLAKIKNEFNNNDIAERNRNIINGNIPIELIGINYNIINDRNDNQNVHDPTVLKYIIDCINVLREKNIIIRENSIEEIRNYISNVPLN